MWQSSFNSRREKKFNEEILCAVNVVENNYSVNSCTCEDQLYRQLFPGSDIAQSFQQADTKVKYVIPYVFLT